jgi:hypothetical protein
LTSQQGLGCRMQQGHLLHMLLLHQTGWHTAVCPSLLPPHPPGATLVLGLVVGLVVAAVLQLHPPHPIRQGMVHPALQVYCRG